MKKGLFFTVLTAAAVLLTGCSTPAPAPVPVQATQSALLGEMQNISDGIVAAGGLAVVGTGESRSPELALDKAKINGRKELKRMLNARVEALAKAFSEEAGIPYDSLFLSGFNDAAGTITRQQIVGSLAQTLKYEPSGETFTAYAVMVLDPKAIADQLAKEKELYARLRPTKAFGELNKEIKAYEAFKAAQRM
jgi:hypothetical protein